MRTKEPITVVCDGCNACGKGFRVSNTVHLAQGPVNLQTIQPPSGWRTALVRPDVAMPPGQSVDANMTAPQLARATDGGVEAALCDKCQKKLAFKPGEPPVLSLKDDAPELTEEEAAAVLDKQREEAQANLQ